MFFIYIFQCLSFGANYHYEKTCTGMNIFRNGMNPFQKEINMFPTGIKTFRMDRYWILGKPKLPKIRNFSWSKNLKEFSQNSNFLDLVWFSMSFFKPWNFEKILSDSYSLENFWFFGSFCFPKFQYLSGMFSFISSISM